MSKKICVYCGARPGSNPVYQREAYALGLAMAERGLELVYGGGGQGIMGAVSQGVIDGGGHAIGVIPDSLMRREFGRRDLARMEVVEDMHKRKMLMADLADAFVALPGGLGTMDELFEIMTWAQLGYHQKPVALLNTANYFDHWLSWLDHMEAEGFYNRHEQGRPMVTATITELLDFLQ